MSEQYNQKARKMMIEYFVIILLMVSLYVVYKGYRKLELKVERIAENMDYHNTIYQELAKQMGGYINFNIETEEVEFIKYGTKARNIVTIDTAMVQDVKDKNKHFDNNLGFYTDLPELIK